MNISPFIMVAPNGARKNKKDHPKLPITIDEIVKCAIDCQKAGADGLHAHIRNKEGEHILDVGLYKELIDEMSAKLPKMLVQITTESVGKYSPKEQREIVLKVRPEAVSVALCEMLSDENKREQRQFYWQVSEMGIKLQHILYSPQEISQLAQHIKEGLIPADNLSLLFVLGRYSKNLTSTPKDLLPFLDIYKKSGLENSSRFMVCAFGKNELDCLLAGARAGGDCRIGFENNHFLPNGKMAKDNAEQVKSLKAALKKL